jgi:hypothetical protein
LEEVIVSNSMNFGVQKPHGGKKKDLLGWLAMKTSSVCKFS